MKNKLKFHRLLCLALALLLPVGCAPAGGGNGGETPELPSPIPPAEETVSDPHTEEPTRSEPHPSTPKPDATDTQAPEAVTEVPELKDKTNPYIPLNYENMKAIWLSQFDLGGVYCASGNQRAEADFRRYAEAVLDNVLANGFNTVIVQVRPNADSMYPSKYYPMSKYVVGSYGKTAAYDPFAILIEEAHERSLSVQAWINPMRAMGKNELSAVSNDFYIKRWHTAAATKGKYVVLNGSSYYLNPAYEDVRHLIVYGARELLLNYEVDGLHMDDYFYPTTDAAFDAAAYLAYKQSGGSRSLSGFRMEMLNLLVSELYAAVKAVNPDMLFGISPAGNDNNVRRDGADIDTWCSTPGYIDYICPQVYFGLEHGSYDFVKVCNTWQSLIKTDRVKLIIGMTLGKAKSGVDNYAGAGKNEWAEHKDILKRCLEHTLTLEKCTGVAYFCYQYFYDPLSGAEETATKTERDNFIPVLKTVAWRDGQETEEPKQ